MLKERLKELREIHRFTQEEVAYHLNLSAQTVSKWERGLVSPDISLLPQIANLYKCSIDYLFDMESVWDKEHHEKFTHRIRELVQNKNYTEAFRMYVREIERCPDNFRMYHNLMHFSYRHHLYEDEFITRMIYMADYALRHCTEDDVRNNIITKITILCSHSKNPEIREKAKFYYAKLPSMHNSREIYTKLVFGEEESRTQIGHNLIYTMQLSENAIRQLITDQMDDEEKLFYYKKAACMYELILEDKFGGFWDSALLHNYLNIAVLLVKSGKLSDAESYIDRILCVLERHLSPEDQISSPLLLDPCPSGVIPYPKLCKEFVEKLQKNRSLLPFKNKIQEMENRYFNYFGFSANTKKEDKE